VDEDDKDNNDGNDPGLEIPEAAVAEEEAAFAGGANGKDGRPTVHTPVPASFSGQQEEDGGDEDPGSINERHHVVQSHRHEM